MALLRRLKDNLRNAIEETSLTVVLFYVSNKKLIFILRLKDQ